MSTPKPFVSDEQIMEMSLVYQSDTGEEDGEPMSAEMRNSASLLHMRDLYELHVQQLVRERDEALAKVAKAAPQEEQGLEDGSLHPPAPAVVELSHVIKAGDATFDAWLEEVKGDGWPEPSLGFIVHKDKWINVTKPFRP